MWSGQRAQAVLRDCVVAPIAPGIGRRALRASRLFERRFANLPSRTRRIDVLKNSRQPGRGAILVSTAALASAVAASSCCLPLLPFVAAAGLAGSSAWFAAVRPYLLGLSVLLIAFAFFQSHRARQCNCRPSKLSIAVLWVSTGIVAVMILFPQAVAELLAGA